MVQLPLLFRYLFSPKNFYKRKLPCFFNFTVLWTEITNSSFDSLIVVFCIWNSEWFQATYFCILGKNLPGPKKTRWNAISRELKFVLKNTLVAKNQELFALPFVRAQCLPVYFYFVFMFRLRFLRKFPARLLS